MKKKVLLLSALIAILGNAAPVKAASPQEIFGLIFALLLGKDCSKKSTPAQQKSYSAPKKSNTKKSTKKLNPIAAFFEMIMNPKATPTPKAKDFWEEDDSDEEEDFFSFDEVKKPQQTKKPNLLGWWQSKATKPKPATKVSLFDDSDDEDEEGDFFAPTEEPAAEITGPHQAELRTADAKPQVHKIIRREPPKRHIADAVKGLTGKVETKVDEAENLIKQQVRKITDKIPFFGKKIEAVADKKLDELREKVEKVVEDKLREGHGQLIDTAGDAGEGLASAAIDGTFMVGRLLCETAENTLAFAIGNAIRLFVHPEDALVDTPERKPFSEILADKKQKALEATTNVTNQAYEAINNAANMTHFTLEIVEEILDSEITQSFLKGINKVLQERILVPNFILVIQSGTAILEYTNKALESAPGQVVIHSAHLAYNAGKIAANVVAPIITAGANATIAAAATAAPVIAQAAQDFAETQREHEEFAADANAEFCEMVKRGAVKVMSYFKASPTESPKLSTTEQKTTYTETRDNDETEPLHSSKPGEIDAAEEIEDDLQSNSSTERLPAQPTEGEIDDELSTIAQEEASINDEQESLDNQRLADTADNDQEEYLAKEEDELEAEEAKLAKEEDDLKRLTAQNAENPTKDATPEEAPPQPGWWSWGKGVAKKAVTFANLGYH